MSLEVNYLFTVDLARPSKSNTLLISKGDTGTRVLTFVLLENGKQFDMSGANSAYLSAKTASGTTVVDSQNCEILTTKDKDGKTVNDNKIRYTIPYQISESAGRSTMDITIMGDGKRITSFEFYVDTRSELYDTDTYSDKDDISGFRDLLNKAMTAVQKVEVMTQASALPCPYPMRITVAGDTYEYNGSSTVEVSFGKLPIIGPHAVDCTALNVY